jgi:hypothetical protein
MAQLQRTAPCTQGKQQHSSLAFIYGGLVFGMLFLTALVSGTFYVLNAAFGRPAAQPVAYAAQLKHVHLNLSILMNQPGMQKDWPGYSNTNLVVPANSVVTVTLHNYDLGDTLFPAGSPFGKVQGTVGNVAAADGTMYAALALDKIAHTFTITQLGINVPIPGDAPKGASYASVTFTFHTGKAGVYTFRCFDPCGTGTSGWMGPMLTKGYMVGTLTVQ